MRVVAMAAMAMLAASCARQQREAALPPPPPVAPPVLTATPGALAINRDLVPGETLWHVRAAVNVAALACTAPAYSAITPQYNAMLKRHEAALTQAYQAEEAHYRLLHGADWQNAFDRHQTALYNSFADPRATQALCAEALIVSARINGMDTALLSVFAGKALADLEAPFALAKATTRVAVTPAAAATALP